MSILARGAGELADNGTTWTCLEENILAHGAGELARALKTSCFFKLFLLFSFSKDDGETRRCARRYAPLMSMLEFAVVPVVN